MVDLSCISYEDLKDQLKTLKDVTHEMHDDMLCFDHLRPVMCRYRAQRKKAQKHGVRAQLEYRSESSAL